MGFDSAIYVILDGNGQEEADDFGVGCVSCVIFVFSLFGGGAGSKFAKACFSFDPATFGHSTMCFPSKHST